MTLNQITHSLRSGRGGALSVVETPPLYIHFIQEVFNGAKPNKYFFKEQLEQAKEKRKPKSMSFRAIAVPLQWKIMLKNRNNKKQK